LINLKRVGLRENNISDSQFKDLKSALPDTSIYR